MKHVKTIKAWADVGSHGGIFEFHMGGIADRYPNLMQVYSKQHTADLVPVMISAVPTGNSRLDWIDKPVTLTIDGGDAAVLLALVSGERSAVRDRLMGRDEYLATIEALRSELIKVQPK